jgi:predicted alpha/beta hydrolase family esterase
VRSPGDIALELWFGISAVFAFGVLSYVGFTFLLASGHVPRRPVFRVLRAAVREATLAVVVSFLLPFYVWGGRRRGKGTQPLVLVHGYTQNRVDFIYLSVALRRRGIGPVFAFNYWSFGDIRQSAERLARFARKVAAEAGTPCVDLVCHSMGGLVARQCVRIAPGVVRRVVTIASPHAGVPFRGPIVGRGGRQLRAGTKFLKELEAVPLGAPTLSIYSKHDNVVFPGQTSSVARWGGRDMEVEELGHLGILFDRTVADAVARFLLEPEPAAPTESGA